MMSRKRPIGLDISGPAFDLTMCPLEEGSTTLEPVCAARCMPMSRIQEHLYIGSWRDLEDPESLHAAGITHILNVAKEVDPANHEASLLGFNKRHIPMVDEQRENLLDHMEAACSFIEEARETNGKVLVHCRRGISRSPAIVVGYLMRHYGHEYDDAVEFVKRHRTCVSLNIAFREFLMSYETPHMKNACSGRTDSCHFDNDGDSEAEQHGPTPGASEGGETNTDAALSDHTGSVLLRADSTRSPS